MLIHWRTIRAACRSLVAAALVIFGIAFVVVVEPAQVAGASTDTVTNCSDSGAGSLRQAVIDASAGDTIDFAPSPSCSLITLTSGDIEITKNLTIDGPGAGALAVSGASLANLSVFVVDNVTATISGLTIKDGGLNAGHCAGGGIDNSGTLTITNSTVSGSLSDCDGGGIYNGSGTVTLTNSTVSGNTCDDGGGIYNGSGMLTVTNSTVSSNTGGGIFNASGTVTVTNSTVSGNTRAGTSGGIYNGSGTVTLTDSTLSDNSVDDGEGGGIGNLGTLNVTDSTLSGNTDSNEAGGGIDNGGTATVTDSTLSDNSAGGGGGIFNEDFARGQRHRQHPVWQQRRDRRRWRDPQQRRHGQRHRQHDLWQQRQRQRRRRRRDHQHRHPHCHPRHAVGQQR